MPAGLVITVSLVLRQPRDARSGALCLALELTLLFSLDAYAAVIDAYMAGLEDRVAAGKSIDTIHSVASFFVSRVDTEVDTALFTATPTVAPKTSLAQQPNAGSMCKDSARRPCRRSVPVGPPPGSPK